MTISPRVKAIIMEATGNNTISAISMVEREEIAGHYQAITGETLNKWCNACTIKACYSIKKAYDENNKEHNKKNGKGEKPDGRGDSALRNRGSGRSTRRGSGS